MKRSELPDEVFGIPEERKYPMPDKRHTLSAIKLFGHVEPKYEEELAKNIIKNMKKYNIPESAVGKDNKLRKYIDKYYNESAKLIEEKYIMNEDDIYYNKDKFDSGEINLCFITGHSGSGKSTMGRNMQSDNIEHYELDDLQCIKDHFTMQNLKEYGDLIYSYFNGQGKRFYVTYQDLKDNNTPGSEYEDILFKDFVHYAMKYAKSHKNKKYVIEGVWLYCDDDNGTPWFTPEEFKDYAFYIKGTSAIISKHRAALRDAKEDSKGNKINTIKMYLNDMIRKNWKWYLVDEKALNKFRKYFSGLMQTNESAELIEERYLINDKDIYYNKDKFDSGEINLCFITGLSGSGKSTMAHKLEGNNIEAYELDDICHIWRFNDPNVLKRYGNIATSFFNSIGKKYICANREEFDKKYPTSQNKMDYTNNVIKDFIKYAMAYAKTYKYKKYIIEGVQIMFACDPQDLNGYAVCIKGTSLVNSFIRASKRDSQKSDNKIENGVDFIKKITNKKKFEFQKENYKKVRFWIDYYKKISTITESFAGEYEKVEVPLTEEVLIEAANNAARHTKWCKMESFPFCSVHELQSCLVSVKDASFAFATFDGSEKDLNYVINSCNRNSTFRYGKYEVSCIPNSQGTKYLCGKITELYEYVKKSILTEETRLDNAPSNMYHLSTENHDGDVFEPRYYDNDNVKAGTERRVKRICFSDSINGCIYSIFPSGAYDVDLYVHIPGSEVTKVYETTQDDIYDSKITHELWVKEPVTMKCIGKIHISGVYKDKVKVLEADKDKTGYGKRKYYEPRWNWVEKINEASIVSNVQDDYNPKGKKSLSSFKKEKISKESLDKYKKDFKALSHIRENCLGYIYLDKNIPMAVIAVEEKSDCNFIQAVEIAKNYQGYGLSKQLLDVATKELKATRLSVNKKNKLAIEIYKKYGFKKYDESESMVFMSINETNLKEFSVGAGPVVGIGSNPEPIYIVNYMQNNVFSGATQERFGICKTGMKDLHTFGGKYNRLHYTNLEEFEKEASNIKVYRYTGPLSDNYSSIYSIIEDADTDLDFYRLLTGNEIDSRSSIKYDPYFQRESYINDELSAITECVVAGVKEIDNKYEIPMIGLNEDGRVYNYYRDLDGVYIKNEITNMRSGSYDDINDIPEEVNNLVIKGVY